MGGVVLLLTVLAVLLVVLELEERSQEVYAVAAVLAAAETDFMVALFSCFVANNCSVAERDLDDLVMEMNRGCGWSWRTLSCSVCRRERPFESVSNKGHPSESKRNSDRLWMMDGIC